MRTETPTEITPPAISGSWYARTKLRIASRIPKAANTCFAVIYPLTFLRFGFARFAAGLALRAAAATTAPGLRIPDFWATFASTALNPGCFLVKLEGENEAMTISV